MLWILDRPGALFVIALLLLGLATRVGLAAAGSRALDQGRRDDLGLVLGATLTLLGLLIGFSVSMAASRYDERVRLEEAEANAIGTAYLRVELLPEADVARAKALLREYTDVRVDFYQIRDPVRLRDVGLHETRLQADLWRGVRDAALRQPTPTTALAVAAINDVLNAPGYTQAAWSNRIPQAAWALLCAVAVLACGLVGYSAHSGAGRNPILLILPLIVAISLVLIADIDSPRGGVIHVVPRNLIALQGTMA